MKMEAPTPLVIHKNQSYNNTFGSDKFLISQMKRNSEKSVDSNGGYIEERSAREKKLREKPNS